MLGSQRYQIQLEYPIFNFGCKAVLVHRFQKATLLIKLIFLSLSSLLTKPVFGWDWIDFFRVLDIVDIAGRKKQQTTKLQMCTFFTAELIKCITRSRNHYFS